MTHQVYKTCYGIKKKKSFFIMINNFQSKKKPLTLMSL